MILGIGDPLGLGDGVHPGHGVHLGHGVGVPVLHGAGVVLTALGVQEETDQLIPVPDGQAIIAIRVLLVREVQLPVITDRLPVLSGVLRETIGVLMGLQLIIPISKMLPHQAIIEVILLGITVIGIQEMVMELSTMDLPVIEIQEILEVTLTTTIIPTEIIAITPIVTPILILQEIPVAITQIGQAVTDPSVQEVLVEVIEAVVEAAVVAEAVDNNLI